MIDHRITFTFFFICVIAVPDKFRILHPFTMNKPVHISSEGYTHCFAARGGKVQDDC